MRHEVAPFCVTCQFGFRGTFQLLNLNIFWSRPPMIVKVYIFWKEIVQGIHICTQKLHRTKDKPTKLTWARKKYILSNSLFFFNKKLCGSPTANIMLFPCRTQLDLYNNIKFDGVCNSFLKNNLISILVKLSANFRS